MITITSIILTQCLKPGKVKFHSNLKELHELESCETHVGSVASWSYRIHHCIDVFT